MKFNQLSKNLQSAIDQMVLNDIDTYCTNVLKSHIENLSDNNMFYTVVHSDKQAIFKLGARTDTFYDIKPRIANYFGLPEDKIFLTNSKQEIILPKILVVDELFPLQTCKIRNDKPTIYVTFSKNMTTQDYILGDQRFLELADKEEADREKRLKEQEAKEQRAQQLKEKNEDMKARYDANLQKEKLR